MSDEKKVQNSKQATKPESSAAHTAAKDVYGTNKGKRQDGRGRGPRRGGDRNREANRDEFEQRILDIARVTRVMAGGKRMNFRACVAIGDKKGKVGVGLGKGADVTMAVNKAVNKAKKDLISVVTINESIPHTVHSSVGAAKLLFKPANSGKGVIAGGVARVILELAGIKNVTSKQMGTNNKINNARCTIEALRSLRASDRKIKNDKVSKEAALPKTKK